MKWLARLWRREPKPVPPEPCSVCGIRGDDWPEFMIRGQLVCLQCADTRAVKAEHDASAWKVLQ